MERATRGHTEGRRESQRGRRRKAGHQVQSEPVGSSKTALNKPPPDCPVEYARPPWPTDPLHRAGRPNCRHHIDCAELKGPHVKHVTRHIVMTPDEPSRRRNWPPSLPATLPSYSNPRRRVVTNESPTRCDDAYLWVYGPLSIIHSF